MLASLPILFAVHISADVLSRPAIVLGFLGMIVLVAIGLWRVKDDEIPRIALLTAAFFVASSIHLPVGPTSVHLLMNGLVGVVLGRRAALAIPIGLLLQAWLLGHGALSTWGVNSCVATIPALAAAPAFRLVIGSDRLGLVEGTLAIACILCPWSLIVVGPLAVAEKRLHWTAEFRGGFLIGATTVLFTALLNSLVLVLGGVEDWTAVAVLALAAHLPVALIEGLVVGAMVNLLMRTKPEMLRIRHSNGNTSASGTSHCPSPTLTRATFFL
jgi:cobalt/nickel transport system permease protein